MRILFSVSISLFLLSGCTWGAHFSSEKSPYPSMPLGVSMEIGIPNDAGGYSYKAKGTEPFWAVDITPGNAKLSRPGDANIITTPYRVTEDILKWEIMIKSVKGDFFLNMRPWDCSDGMSETKYHYSTTLLVGAESLTGCALKME